LLVDFGGVLTTPITHSFRAACRDLGLRPDLVKEVVLEAYGDASGEHLIHRIETGQLAVSEFAAELASAITERSGTAVDGGDLMARLFAHVELDEAMLAGVESLQATGVPTALLSNSWGDSGYPRERFAALFDAVVISGEVGLRKPDEAIFLLAAERLGVPAGACVFVDDLEANIAAAEALGMTGVTHRGPEQTLPRVAELLGVESERVATD
jgi:putative hydrolase of the HAD superfamily